MIIAITKIYDNTFYYINFTNSYSLSIIIGIINAPNDIVQGVLVGITLGLAGIGLYCGTKHVVRK